MIAGICAPFLDIYMITEDVAQSRDTVISHHRAVLGDDRSGDPKVLMSHSTGSRRRN
ncbi:hypothetical protein [Sphingomonas sp. HMP9]|uniref:hypothetical protein n=1 Tax=Sphingomonas sp. HMP9 TaxID=1517554 RepID=UPI0015969336|nr:hypothetical protein [Sphingomonas sp. HMP9]